METQLEMLGILYSVALRAENGVRSVTDEFFKTFQRALQEINKPEPNIRVHQTDWRLVLRSFP